MVVEKTARGERPYDIDIDFTVDGETALEKMRKATLVVARAVLRENKEFAGEGDPVLLIDSIDSGGVRVRVTLPTVDPVAAEMLRDQFWSALAKRFKTDKITLT